MLELINFFLLLFLNLTLLYKNYTKFGYEWICNSVPKDYCTESVFLGGKQQM